MGTRKAYEDAARLDKAAEQERDERLARQLAETAKHIEKIGDSQR